ncbi:MAG: 2-phospho-L-lactate transferase CofD family protein [Desulfocapsa sp.]|nr:2-phospho-L-lactate transferase CofD family protein [Desulfocapsa sp.]
MDTNRKSEVDVAASLRQIEAGLISPLDLLPHEDLREKLVELALSGVPEGIPSKTASGLQQIKDALEREPVEGLNVVVFGGGTGLSTIIGGDSRSVSWIKEPFSGLKSIFPKTRSIVCITDDGGSTGELLKDLPLIALGDIRHVLLSSIQLVKLQELYNLTELEAVRCVETLAAVFNHRFFTPPANSQQLLVDSGLARQKHLPSAIEQMLAKRIDNLFADSRLKAVLSRPHCLGNLILASSIYEQIPEHYTAETLLDEQDLLQQNLQRGIASLCVVLGADEQAVVPCTSVPAELSVCYANGVQVTGEHKSYYANRGYPVDRVCVNFCEEPPVSSELLGLIRDAHIMIMAPGSLYSSLIPVFQVPGIVEAVKANKNALKILVSNLWVQTGETDLSLTDPERKFHLSDLLNAYKRNIPGGTEGLFEKVLCLSFKDVPATVIQNYAVEGKIPIYLDRDKVLGQGIVPLECSIYSKAALRDHGVIRHDPKQFSLVVRTLWASFLHIPAPSAAKLPTDAGSGEKKKYLTSMQIPCLRYKKIKEFLSGISIELQGQAQDKTEQIRKTLQRILWDHKDIPLAHLQFVHGVQCIATEEWKRDQHWDKVYSFYDPEDGYVKIRQDQFDSVSDLEVAFLVAVGQSLLGNYAASKEIDTINTNGIFLGKIYHLHLKDPEKRKSYFNEHDLAEYLILSRMVRDGEDENHFTRLVNGREGFTPPGLLFGLTYAWYLDNRFASHIEYKMAVIKIDHSNLIPEQVRMKNRREKLIVFFREVVFKH